MPILTNFPVAQQETENACWASAARAIVNWYHLSNGLGPSYKTDQALADAWALKSRVVDYGNIKTQQSASAALADLGFENNIDIQPISIPDEIAAVISTKKPLLALIGTAPPEPSPNPNYQGGHWVVIIGIHDTRARTTLAVFDPVDGQVHHVPYDTAEYRNGSFWQNTSYVDEYKHMADLLYERSAA